MKYLDKIFTVHMQSKREDCCCKCGKIGIFFYYIINKKKYCKECYIKETNNG